MTCTLVAPPVYGTGTPLPEETGAPEPLGETGVVVLEPIGPPGVVPLLGYGAGAGIGAGAGAGAAQMEVSLTENETLPSPAPDPGCTSPLLLHAERLLFAPQLQHVARLSNTVGATDDDIGAGAVSSVGALGRTGEAAVGLVAM
ncbi:hypothetical protein LTR27_011906 [Elasticomyces elasticus]|nr:hypothetical protein LTR27_011906 [Elasticomyces elasticus]